MEQEMIKKNIEIKNAPKNETPIKTFMIMAKKLNSKIEEKDIADIYRNKISGKIVVKFNHIQNKNEFMQQCKRKKLKSGDVINTNNKKDNNKHIFVNDELTHHNRKLFWTTKNTAKEKGWKFI